MLILRHIQATAEADPRRLALVYNGVPLGYGRFWRLIDAWRAALAPETPDHGVALVLIDNLLDAWIITLALWARGLDTCCLQNGDQAAWFEGVDVACLITADAEHKAAAAPPGARRLVIGTPSRRAVSVGDPVPPAPDQPRECAHIQFTSGTTGRPKLAPTNPTPRGKDYAQLGDQVVPYGPDMAVNVFNQALWSGGGMIWAITSWSFGGALVIQQTEDLHRVFDWPGVTHTIATPWYLSRLMAQPEGAFPVRPDMQIIHVAGELTAALWRETARRLTPRIMIMVGATEAGAFGYSVVKSEEDLHAFRPWAGRRVEVVDDDRRALPAGRLGRLRVLRRGIDPAGYVGQGGDAFAGDWVYPGDLAVAGADGRMSLFGRVGDVLNILGEKRPAQPWEQAIQARLACEAVCLMSGPAQGGADTLFVCIESRRPLVKAEVDAALRAVLPRGPTLQVRSMVLPRTETGKVRRAELARWLFEGGRAD